MMDAISESRLEGLHPLLVERAHSLAQQLEGQGTEIRVTMGLRSWNEQASLYAQGRTIAGRIVTNAPAGHSWHEFSLAIDVVPMENGQPQWDVAHPAWAQIVRVADVTGLFSGSKFDSIKDWPHLQLMEIPLSPNDEVRQVFLDGGIIGVWQLLNLPS